MNGIIRRQEKKTMDRGELLTAIMQGRMDDPDVQAALEHLQADPELKAAIERISSMNMQTLMADAQGGGLFQAIHEGDVEALTKELQAGDANTSAINEENLNPLQCAAYHGQRACAQALIAHGVDIDETAMGTQSAMIIAMAQGHEDIALDLIAAGAAVDGKLPLCLLASSLNQVAALKALVDKGADINAPDEEGDRPIFQAIKTGDTQLATTI